MSIRGKAAIVGIGETPTDRLGSKPGEPRRPMQDYLATAMRLALADAGLTKKDLDGQGLGAIYGAGQSQAFWPAEAADILGRVSRPSPGGWSGRCQRGLAPWPGVRRHRGRVDRSRADRRRGRAVRRAGRRRSCLLGPRFRVAVRRHGSQQQDRAGDAPPHARIRHHARSSRQNRRRRSVSCEPEPGRLSTPADHHRRLQALAPGRRSDPAPRLRDAGQRRQGVHRRVGRALSKHRPASGASARVRREGQSFVRAARRLGCAVTGISDSGRARCDGRRHPWRHRFSPTLRRLHHRRPHADRGSGLLRQGRSCVSSSGPISPSRAICRS